MKNTILFLALIFLINFSNAQSSFTSYDIPESSKANEQKEDDENGTIKTNGKLDNREFVSGFTQECEDTVNGAADYFKTYLQDTTNKGFAHVEYDFEGMVLSSTFNYVGHSVSTARLAISEYGNFPTLVNLKYDSEGNINAIDILQFEDYVDLVFVIEPLVAEACHRQFEIRTTGEDLYSNEKFFENNTTTQFEVKDIKMKMIYIVEIENIGEIGDVTETFNYLESVKQEHSKNGGLSLNSEYVGEKGELTKTETSIKGQKQEKIYYNSDWKVLSSQSNAEYYRLITMNENGKPLGKVKDYYISGKLQFEGYFSYVDKYDDSKDIKDSLCNWYYENGQLNETRNYENGKLNGEQREYYENGQLKEIGKLYYGEKTGDWEFYYENGKLQSVANYTDGKLTGEWKTYHENGQLHSAVNYTDGKLTGERKMYFENGTLMEIGSYINGKLTGELKTYHENGQLESVGNYTDGKLTGEWKFYHENGPLRKVGNYTDGKETGDWKMYYENGQLQLVANFTDGKKTGEWKVYFENGQLQSIEYYQDDEDIYVNEWKYYDEYGNEKK